MEATSAIGCILGTAVGDALGLPFEGLSPARAAKLFPDRSHHHLLFGRGMVSDDTEHACMTAQALIASGGDPERFAGELARRLRWWIASLPAGVGLATARAGLKLWAGFGPRRSGVYSAGNGPAMRAPVLGLFARDPGHLQELVQASTVITHTDPKALRAALVVAVAARLGSSSGAADGDQLRAELSRIADDDPQFSSLLERAVASARARQGTAEFARDLGLARGVSGYIYHTVPVCLHAWMRHPSDFRSAVTAVIECGGDTDTTAAIVGGIVGATTGEAGIPREWTDGIAEWPRSVRWMRELAARAAQAAASRAPDRPPALPPLGVLARNTAFLGIVLTHGIRRAFPPY